MQKILLTSSGFDNPKLKEKAIQVLRIEPPKAKVLFIVSAAVTDQQKEILTLCKNEILDMGVLDKNIDTYDFDYALSKEEVIKYHMIYVAGGHTATLEDKFDLDKLPLDHFLQAGGLYLGVSAGSLIMTKSYPNHLNYLDKFVKVHEKNASISIHDKTISLTDNQGILIIDGLAQLIE